MSLACLVLKTGGVESLHRDVDVIRCSVTALARRHRRAIAGFRTLAYVQLLPEPRSQPESVLRRLSEFRSATV